MKTVINQFATVTMNGARYCAMISEFLLPAIEARDVNDIWFQQDGATAHTPRKTMDLLRHRIGEQLISRFGPVSWPPRSCDITPLDLFHWGCVKSKVYADKPATIQALEAMSCRVSLTPYRSKCSNESSKIGASEWTS